MAGLPVQGEGFLGQEGRIGYLSGHSAAFEFLSPATALLVLLFCLLVPTAGEAAELRVASDTLLRYFERDRKADGKTVGIAPAYQYLQMDYGALNEPGLSVHAYGWGRANLGDSLDKRTWDAALQQDTAGEFLYGYLQYLRPARDLQVRLGRQYLFEGVANESFDGLYVRADILPSVELSAYAGSPVAVESSKGRSGDRLYGARLYHGKTGSYSLGVSYKFLADDGIRDMEVLGGDLSLSLPGGISLLGRSSLNLVTGGVGEHSYEARFFLGPMEIRPLFQRYRYSDYFNKGARSALLFRYLADNTITMAGTEAFWYPGEQWEVGLRFKNYDYDKRLGSARSYTALVTWKRNILSEIGVEAGLTDGSDDRNRYFLGRAYAYWNLAPAFLTGDLVLAHYGRPVYGKEQSLFASVGTGVRLAGQRLSLKLSCDYSDDPYFDKDIRFTLVASYQFDRQSAPADAGRGSGATTDGKPGPAMTAADVSPGHPAPSLTLSVGENPYRAGSTAAIPLLLTNTGKTAGAYELSTGFPKAFSPRIVAADKPSQAIVRTPRLEAGASFAGLLLLDIPANTLDGASVAAGFSAVPVAGGPTVTKDIRLVAAAPYLRAVVRVDSAKRQPGERVDYQVVLLNAGSVAAGNAGCRLRIPSGFDVVKVEEGWSWDETASMLTIDGGRLGSGEMKKFVVELHARTADSLVTKQDVGVEAFAGEESRINAALLEKYR